MTKNDPRQVLAELIRTSGDDFASVSRMLGRNAAYIQQYIKRGSPKVLPEKDRRALADFYHIDERLLGGMSPAAQPKTSPNALSDTGGLISIRQLDVGASAGPGSHTDDNGQSEAIAFGPKWLKRIGGKPEKLSLILVQGDSMEPTLFDGDDIIVDHDAAERPVRDGIYVLRMDDVLLVKRLAIGPSGGISVRSDNSQYPDWDGVDPAGINIIGRVVWTGRRL